MKAMRCWDVHDGIANALVVFAPNRRDARRLAGKHLGFKEYAGPVMTVIERLPSASSPAGQQLYAALVQETSGIGYWLGCGGWMILPPDIRPAQSVRPLPTHMHTFVDDEDYQVVLFAHDDDRADDLHSAIAGKLDRLPEGWLGSEWDAWRAVGLVRHQRQAEERGIEGVGIYTKRGWQILPLDYEAFGIDPPDG